MPNRMIERKFLPGVKNCSKGIGASTGDEQDKAARRQGLNKGFDGENDDPAHQNVGDRGDNLKTMDEENFQENSDEG